MPCYAVCSITMVSKSPVIILGCLWVAWTFVFYQVYLSLRTFGINGTGRSEAICDAVAFVTLSVCVLFATDYNHVIAYFENFLNTKLTVTNEGQVPVRLRARQPSNCGFDV
jgi:hypothetical protein